MTTQRVSSRRLCREPTSSSPLWGVQIKNENVTAYIAVDDTAYTIFRGSYTSTGSSSVLVQLELGQRGVGDGTQ